MRMWHVHPIRHRLWLAMVARYPQLLALNLTPEQGADILSALRAIARRDARRMLKRELVALLDQGAAHG
jgi:hypothetical protein